MAFTKQFWLGLAVFILSLTVDLYYNLTCTMPGRLHIFDSCHYIQAGLFLSMAVQHTLGATTAIPQPLGQMLLLDGFGMPFCAAIAALLSSNTMSSLSLIFVQSAIVSLTALAIYSCAIKMKLPPSWATTAGLVWVFYPPAIISAGTFLSEPLSGLLVAALTLTALDCWVKKTPSSWFCFAFICGCILTTKPALIIYLALILVLFLITLRPLPRLKLLGSGVAGGIAALLPWLLVTALYTGHPEIMPSRLPSTNMALGSDSDVGYWETMPVPPGTLRNYARNPIRVFYELITTRTGEMPQYLATKFARLWFGPFNDFHDAVFTVNYSLQRLLHATLLVSAMLAIPFILLSKKTAREEKIGVALVTAALLTHCCYMPFESLSRYAFSAVPLLILAAVCYWRQIFTGKTLLPIVVILFGTIAVASVQFDDVKTEIFTLKQGQTASRTVLPSTTASTSGNTPNWIALVFDCDLKPENCTLTFNGDNVVVNPANMEAIPSGFIWQSAIDDIKAQASRARNVSADKLAHYRVIFLPLSLFKANQANTIVVKALKPIELFDQPAPDQAKYRLVPALRYFSVTKMAASARGLDGRVPDHAMEIVSTSSSSINATALKNKELRLFLLVSDSPDKVIPADAGHVGSKLHLW